MAKLGEYGCGQEGELSRQNASPKAVKEILAASETSLDGRSQWMWIRLPEGDLVLGVYPMGDTYFRHEDERKI